MIGAIISICCFRFYGVSIIDDQLEVSMVFKQMDFQLVSVMCRLYIKVLLIF
jgi:hypothetical protein